MPFNYKDDPDLLFKKKLNFNLSGPMTNIYLKKTPAPNGCVGCRQLPSLDLAVAGHIQPRATLFGRPLAKYSYGVARHGRIGPHGERSYPTPPCRCWPRPAVAAPALLPYRVNPTQFAVAPTPLPHCGRSRPVRGRPPPPPRSPCSLLWSLSRCYCPCPVCSRGGRQPQMGRR